MLFALESEDPDIVGTIYGDAEPCQSAAGEGRAPGGRARAKELADAISFQVGYPCISIQVDGNSIGFHQAISSERIIGTHRDAGV